MTIISAILLFGFLIFIHELGHFIFAKMSNVKVLKFSLGFGPKIIGKKIGETEYLISAIPLGGYVKMFGEDPEDKETEQPSNQNSDSDIESAYRNQPIYKRAAIVFAGPAFNLLTAAVIFFFISMFGIPVLLPIIGEVIPNGPADRAMLAKGDRIMEIDGKPLKSWAEMTEIIYRSAGKALNLKIQRGTEILDIQIIPEPKEIKDIFGEKKKIGLIGIKPSNDTIIVKEGVLNSAKNAFIKTWEISALTIIGVIKMLQRIIPADTIGGPILIFQMAEKEASAGALNFFFFAAVISINLGILNLLPVPVLDGGHLLFMGIEAIRKKPLSQKTIIIAQRAGMALLIALMAFAMYNDIFRLFNGKSIP